MSTYIVTAASARVADRSASVLTLKFGAPAQNDQIVKDAVSALEACKLEGGAIVLLNGPASLPVACALAHGIAHRFGAVGCFDPKLNGYVVCTRTTPPSSSGRSSRRPTSRADHSGQKYLGKKQP